MKTNGYENFVSYHISIQKKYIIAALLPIYCANSPSWNMNFELNCDANLNYHRIMRMVITITRAPAGNYMFKVNNKNTRTKCEIRSELTLKILASLWCLYC